MEDKFCNYILALILIFLQQKNLPNQAHILGTHAGLSSHFTLKTSILASFQQSMLTFQEHILVSHLILPPLSLILAIYAHILGRYVGVSSHFTSSQPHFSNLCPFQPISFTFQLDFIFLHFFWPNWSCFPLNVFTSTCARVSLQPRFLASQPRIRIQAVVKPDSWLVSQESRLQLSPILGQSAKNLGCS